MGKRVIVNFYLTIMNFYLAILTLDFYQKCKKTCLWEKSCNYFFMLWQIQNSEGKLIIVRYKFRTAKKKKKRSTLAVFTYSLMSSVWLWLWCVLYDDLYWPLLYAHKKKILINTMFSFSVIFYMLLCGYYECKFH